jgi:Holliday junction resolvase RusA-like endonuclease
MSVHFPSSNVILTALKQHPLTKALDEKILSAVAGFFGDQSQSEQMIHGLLFKCNPELVENITKALLDCAEGITLKDDGQ